MGNRHGGEKAAKEDKEEKRRKKKEKKAKKKQKKKTGAAGSDLDLDPESSQFSRADSESLVFHSAENLSPYLDASTRSEEGAACAGFYDNGHILSSKDFHDGFSIEACLPADLAASALMSDVTADATKVGDDVTSMASGVYSTPLLSSPDVRRGIPRSPLAQRQKDSFVEPVPPIPSDFSSNTLSSVSYQEGVSTPGTQRSSSRASSSTVDTNAAHCIERLEELERNIERTIIEKFAPIEPSGWSTGTHSENTTPRLARRADFGAGERSREGSVTPKGIGSDGGPAQSAENSPAVVRKISEPCRPTVREGSSTPKGIIQGVWSQSAENSPVIVRKALPSPESPIILRRTPSQSPSVERKFPANAPESPVFYRRAINAAESPSLSPSTPRRLPGDSQEKSPQLVRRDAPQLELSGATALQKAKVPPPVPPKPVMKTLTSPEIARRLQNMPKSPIMARKVYAFQEQPTKDKSPIARDEPWDRSWREHQMPPKSPSRSPEVRHRVARKTPSSSPSPKSLVRKLMPQEDRAPPPVGATPTPLTQVQFCQQQKGIPVKHFTVATQPSAAVVLDVGPEEDSVAEKTSTTSPQSAEAKQSHIHTSTPPSKDSGSETATWETVSEDAIKKSTESAVFGSVSPKLKRQKKILSGDDSSQSGSFDHQRGDSTDSSTRSPPCSPPVQRSRPTLAKTGVKDSEGSDHSPIRGSIDRPDQSPGRQRAQFHKQNSRCKEDGTLSADIAGGLTYHAHLLSDEVTSDPHPLRDQTLAADQQSKSAHYPVTLQDMDSSGKKETQDFDRRGVEGGSTQHPGIQMSHTALPLSRSLRAADMREAETSQAEISESAVTAESTVGKNAREQAGYTGGEHVTATSARQEPSRACWRESEQRVAAPCQRVPSPPCQPGTASAAAAATDAKPGPLSKSLGQRIRDVINESTFREVFTAELSSSSERDEATYTSDDSVFAHGAPHSLHPHPRPYWHRPAPERETHATSSSPLSSPSCQRAGRGECTGERTGGQATPPPPHGQGSSRGQPFPDPLHPQDPVTLTQPLPLSPSLDSSAIRRIDIDVNVILPEGESQERAAPASANQRFPPGSQCEVDGGQGAEMMDRQTGDSGADADQETRHSSHRADSSESGAKTDVDKQHQAEAGREQEGTPPTTHEKTKTPAMMEGTRAEENLLPETAIDASDYKKGNKHSKETKLDSAPPASLPASAPSLQATYEASTSEQGERSAEGESAADSRFPPESESRSQPGVLPGQERQAAQKANTDSAQPSAPTSKPVSGHQSAPVLSSPLTPSEQSQHPQARDAQHQNGQLTGARLGREHQTMTDSQQTEGTPQENVPPPSPTAMDTLAEEEEEEEGEDVNSMINAHQDSDISSKISQEMQLFGETVVRRLSSLLESQASESDSCLEEARTDFLTVPSRRRKPDDIQGSKLSDSADQQQSDSLSKAERSGEADPHMSLATPSSVPHIPGGAESGPKDVVSPVQTSKEDVEPVLHEELNTLSTSDLPGERLVTSDTTETLSTDHDTSASSKRESTASTATDETLTSFKTRSTTDSAEFEDAFILPESLVFVRSVNEGAEEERAVVESGRIIKRPPIPAELTRYSATPETTSHKPRKKRRRQIGTHDVSARADVTEPEPKRGSKQIEEVIDAYCEEMSDDSDISSSTDDILSDEIVHKTTYSRNEQQPRLPSSVELEHRVKDIVRKPKPPADRSTDSSDESAELEAKRQSSSSHDSSFRIPEIEETFGELMGVKTFLEDLEDKTPTSEPPPLLADEEKFQAKEFPPSAHHRRRSKTSPARTDRTESDLDVSEHRDDASTDSMYADDEDEGAELVFQRSYSEEHGGEVVLSCTIYNSSHDNDADSDDFWADAEAAAAADESYKTLETAADAAGSAFQNARIQMHDIHQHLQDLRRQMELLQDDITSTSLTLTPEFSLESEQRPVTE